MAETFDALCQRRDAAEAAARVADEALARGNRSARAEGGGSTPNSIASIRPSIDWRQEVTQPIDADATVAALHERLTGLRAELDATRNARDAAQVKAANGVEGAQAEADRFDVEVQRLERSIATTEEALAAVDRATAEIATEAEQAQAKRNQEMMKTLSRAVRKAADEVDAQVTAVGPALLALREATKALWEASDGPTRRDALGELPRLLADMPMVIHERLAHGGVLASRSVNFDRTAEPPSVAGHLDIALREFAPPPGRPRKGGNAEAPKEIVA